MTRALRPQFADEGHDIIVCQSYSKNFGLYGERAGCCTVVRPAAALLVPPVAHALGQHRWRTWMSIVMLTSVACRAVQVTGDAKSGEAVASQLKKVVRPNYSNPPIHGARIVKTVLGDPELEAQWCVRLPPPPPRPLPLYVAA